MKLKNVMIAGAIAAVTAFSQAAFAAKGEINIAYVKSPFNLQNIVMKQHQLLEKEFKKDGIKVNWFSINTASLLMANGADNRVYVATGVARPTQVFAIVGKPGQQMKVEDLKGKKVAGPKGTVLHQVLVAALQSKGLKASDVELIQMDIPKAHAALLGGHVDAALLAAGNIIQANAANAKTIATAQGYVDPLLVVAVSEKFAKENPQLLERIVKVHRSTTKWIEQNQDKAIAMGAKEH